MVLLHAGLWLTQQWKKYLNDFYFNQSIRVILTRSFTQPELFNNFIKLHNWQKSFHIYYSPTLPLKWSTFILLYLDVDFTTTLNRQRCLGLIWTFFFFQLVYLPIHKPRVLLIEALYYFLISGAAYAYSIVLLTKNCVIFICLFFHMNIRINV